MQTLVLVVSITINGLRLAVEVGKLLTNRKR
jgi:hypothetical protein